LGRRNTGMLGAGSGPRQGKHRAKEEESSRGGGDFFRNVDGGGGGETKKTEGLFANLGTLFVRPAMKKTAWRGERTSHNLLNHLSPKKKGGGKKGRKR